jgi:hypothetical protein
MIGIDNQGSSIRTFYSAYHVLPSGTFLCLTGSPNSGCILADATQSVKRGLTSISTVSRSVLLGLPWLDITLTDSI